MYICRANSARFSTHFPSLNLVPVRSRENSGRQAGCKSYKQGNHEIYIAIGNTSKRLLFDTRRRIFAKTSRINVCAYGKIRARRCDSHKIRKVVDISIR